MLAVGFGVEDWGFWTRGKRNRRGEGEEYKFTCGVGSWARVLLVRKMAARERRRVGYCILGFGWLAPGDGMKVLDIRVGVCL